MPKAPGSLSSPRLKITPLNWRAQGKVSPVKQQGRCGSCWAFAATASIESSRRVQLNKKGNFAEQQVLDCTYTTRDGCNGGWMHTAYQYLIGSSGLHREKNYPYVSGDTRTAGNC